MLMLVLLYDLHRTEEILRLNQSRPTTFRARMLAGKTIGLIGYGRIAAAVAQRLSGWEARILAYSPRAAARRYPAVNFVELEELLSTSDIVSLHTTLLPETRHLLNAKRLALMRPSSILVNTSRGAIVDEAALCEALKSGRIAGAALDTFEEEPLREDSPLRSLPNVVLTPHMVGHTQEIFDAMPEVTYENVVRLLRGDAPVYFRNPDVFERWQVRLAELADAP